MEIAYKSNKIKKVCEEPTEARKRHGNAMARAIFQRMREIEAAESVDELIKFRIGRCHKLGHNRAGQYAMDLVQPYRLVFTVVGAWAQIAVIEEIVNYH